MSTSATLRDLTIEVNHPQLMQKTLQLLDEQGVMIIRNYLDASKLQSLIGEYEKLLELENNFVKVLPYPQGKGTNIDFSKLPTDQFPITTEVFNAAFMRKVTDAYLGTPNHFNHEIFVARDEHHPHNALNDMHYDRLSTLKFFLYLNDIDASNGAFECVPGSHKLARQIMDFYRKRGWKLVKLPNRKLPPHLDKGIPMAAPAGSLIVFTTDAYHRAGSVDPGKNRMIMRGHCRPDPMPKYGPKLFSSQWLQESPLNLARYYYAISDRFSGDKPY
ncbi:MAG: phytanoyl-CoA dioxygenase family protein [Salibacteraceae bacterium]